jgi:23S rRNA (cytidine1920-2'-O)/16S rRNA (cytidine1409-2'-O)-methyltransferase
VASGRRRLDAELVRRNLAESRTAAQAMIEARTVLVAGTLADKPARQVAPGDSIEVLGPPPKYVSRGGLKLEAALDAFEIDVAGRTALDAGASTGGFTDCLLQRDVASVTAVDVGYGQLHERVRTHPKVTAFDRTNIRSATVATVGGPFELVVADLSFISITTVIDALIGLTARSGDHVVLVKPQFEAGREEVAKGRGIIRDPAVWRRTVAAVTDAYESRGWEIGGEIESPIHGADGNTEFLVWAKWMR